MANSVLLNGVAFVFHSHTPLYPYFIAFCCRPPALLWFSERALIHNEAFLTESGRGSAADKENNYTLMVSFLRNTQLSACVCTLTQVQTVITNGPSSG